MVRRRGFTLIELLVVIAIIGILAAMLFPVFARARESARKTQCLANVKNIATAVQMYLADYDKWVPNESDRRAIDYFADRPGGKSGDPFVYPEVCNRARQANPYLREPVILEDYVKSREVWKCPSARLMAAAGCIIPVGRDGYWLNSWIDTEGTWGTGKTESGTGPCYVAWPTGWGGDVTDSLVQQTMASAATSNVYQGGIGLNDNLRFTNISSIQDASRFIACGDNGRAASLWDAASLAYPDNCGLTFCGGKTKAPSSSGPCPATCATADWANCPTTTNCGFDPKAWDRFFSDPAYQKTFTRHMGGSNVGFMDGHAKWFNSNAIMTQSEPFKDPYFDGTCSCWPGNGVAE